MAKVSDILEKKQNGGIRAGQGRKKGAINKLTAEAVAMAKESGKTPLQVMLDIMHSTEDERMKLTAAQAAAPYVHAKLANIEMKVEGAIAITSIERRIVKANN